MILYEERPLLVLHEADSGIVLGTVPTAACAQMLMLGLPNTQVDWFPVQMAHRRNEWDGHDFNAADQLYVMLKGWKVAPAAPDLATPQTTHRRQLMRLRLPYLHSWEIYCRGALVRVRGYMSDAVQAFIRQELGAADSVYVDEYAHLHGLGRDSAREELGVKVRSLGLAEARNWAQYEKIAQDMGRAETREQLDACMRRGLELLYHHARG
jgi:hypothetical protein